MTGDVDENASICGCDRAERESELNTAVASQRLERVTGEALGVDACQDVGAPLDLAMKKGKVDVARGELERAHIEGAPRRWERYLDDFDGHAVPRKWVRL